MPWRSIAVGLAALAALLICCGAEAGPTLAPGDLRLTPSFQRLDTAPDQRVERSLTLQAPVDATILAIDVDCRCVTATLALPTQAKAGMPLAIPLSIAGSLPGMKTITVRTTAGSVMASVQIVSQGLGSGRSVLAGILAHARREHWAPVFILHDLHGQIRNCGCSGGSLGGLDHLAALPGLVAREPLLSPAVFVLSGDVDGQRPGVEQALTPFGWRRDQRVITSATPAADVARPEILAVIPTVRAELNHMKLVRPILTDGMQVEVLLIDDHGAVQFHHSLPIDGTLPSDAAILTLFPDHPATARVEMSRSPSQDCRACHAASHQTWSMSRHALAWTSLKTEDRTDACISCHSMPVAAQPPTVVPGVQCQSCHLGADAHAAAPATVKTRGSIDCRSCHDARHDPGFDPVRAWAAIAHSR